MKLIFERHVAGSSADMLPQCDLSSYGIKEIDSSLLRTRPLDLPEVAESEVDRHFSALERRTHGVNDGFYPLGSCTMKYNPKLSEQLSSLRAFTDVHPLQPVETTQGSLELLANLTDALCEISGMDDASLQPAAGAHGEFAGIMMIKAYHASRGDTKRVKIIVPDSAHGTNPASAAMCAFDVVTVPSKPDGGVDVDALKLALGGDTAGIMLTNPSTLGLFEKNILQITSLVHEAGGLCYYDGANLNALMGVARPGDMGFDVMHMNLHKTFATPHGGGGPGGGVVACKSSLAAFLPLPRITRDGGLAWSCDNPQSIGRVRSFYGNFLVCVRAYAYITRLGADGIREAAESAVLNANYLMSRMPREFLPYKEPCKHEFVLSLKKLKVETGVSALDVAKGLLDYGMHPPTMYFPLIVEEALMFEPTETETRETLDEAADVFLSLIQLARENPESLKTAPHGKPISRPDEVLAARNIKIRWVG